ARLWRSFRPGGPAGPCPPLEPLLRQQAGLDDLPPEAAAALAASFVAEPMEEGQVILLEGEPGWCGYIVAEGTVEVLRNVRGDRAELLAKLGAGRQFGMNTLVIPGPRTASCVAATAGWLYRLDREPHEALAGQARRAWRESILAVLSSQIRTANGALDRALRKSGQKLEGDSFQSLLQASGFLEAAPSEEALERVQFVVDEDMKRNPRNPARRS
ncbi:MAG: cyclic nucleotide-binding domain-containing protein, partial [Deltaproteobacteria bacterium]|nr:cyclic nucleotide-binding domain-containing protein [Deltaproteobacteria bacterium]